MTRGKTPRLTLSAQLYKVSTAPHNYASYHFFELSHDITADIETLNAL